MTATEPTSAHTATGGTALATLQHLRLIRERAAKLASAQEDTENQLLHSVGGAFRCGQIDVWELIEVFNVYREMEIPGRSRRWNENVSINWHSMAAMSENGPNGPHRTWIGDWPVHYLAPMPARGVSVVYVLFDDSNEPCYVGSSRTFRTRLNGHAKDGKRFVHWQAHPCRDREHAYEVEDRLLKERKPYLNRKASR